MLNEAPNQRRPGFLSAGTFYHVCVASGVTCVVMSCASFVTSGFVPPLSATLSAEQVVKHYRNHHGGIQAGAALLMTSGMFFLPLTAGIAAQMRRIPKLNGAMPALQLASGASAVPTFIVPAIFLAVTNFRLERAAESTQLLNDLFWITVMMPYQPLMMQSWSFAYAILYDGSEKPIFPKALAVVNIVAPIIYIPALTVHCFFAGPLAWNGAYNFWVAGIVYIVQLLADCFSLWQAASTDSDTCNLKPRASASMEDVA